MTSLFACTLVLTTAQSASLDTILKEIETALQSGAVSKMSEKDARDFVDTFAKRVDLTTVTLRDARRITDSVLIFGTTMPDRLQKHLAGLKPTNESDKTFVLVLRSALNEGSAASMAKEAELAVTSPGAAAFVASDQGDALVSMVTTSLATNPEDVLKPFFTLMSGKLSPESAGALKDFWTEYATSGIKTDFDARHDVVTKAIDQAIAQLKPDQADQRAELTAASQYMKSPFASGRLLNYSAPEIDFTWISDGAQKKLSQFKGQVVVLDFWATWCGPCVRSFPKIAEVVKHYEGKPVKVIGVTSPQGAMYFGDKTTECKTPEEEYKLMPDYMKQKGLTWTVAFSQQDVFNPDYGVQGIPNMVIIDKKGVVRHIGLNPLGVSKDEKIRMIDALLAE